MRLTARSVEATKAAHAFTVNEIQDGWCWVMVYAETGAPCQLHAASGPMLYQKAADATRAVTRLNPNIRMLGFHPHSAA